MRAGEEKGVMWGGTVSDWNDCRHIFKFESQLSQGLVRNFLQTAGNSLNLIGRSGKSFEHGFPPKGPSQ